LSRYERRCEEITKEGADAKVEYPSRKKMTRGNTELVTAVVKLTNELPSEAVPGKPGSERGLVVSCSAEARLRGSKYAFSIDDTNWQRRSFVTWNTVSWTWEVGPKIGGEQTLVLDVRPIVSIQAARNASGATPNQEIVRSYPIEVDVSVPWAERPAEVMSRLADTFKVAQGLVETLTALLAALIAFAGTVGIKRRRAKGAGGQQAEAGPSPG
jgi:hypothetical protein